MKLVIALLDPSRVRRRGCARPANTLCNTAVTWSLMHPRRRLTSLSLAALQELRLTWILLPVVLQKARADSNRRRPA